MISPFATKPVAQVARQGLQHPPDRRVDRLQHSNAFDAKTERGKEHGEDGPAHTVVQVIDQARLARSKEISVAEGGSRKDFAKTDRQRLGMLACFEPHMLTRIPHCKNGKS